MQGGWSQRETVYDDECSLCVSICCFLMIIQTKTRVLPKMPTGVCPFSIIQFPCTGASDLSCYAPEGVVEHLLGTRACDVGTLPNAWSQPCQSPNDRGRNIPHHRYTTALQIWTAIYQLPHYKGCDDGKRAAVAGGWCYPRNPHTVFASRLFDLPSRYFFTFSFTY